MDEDDIIEFADNVIYDLESRLHGVVLADEIFILEEIQAQLTNKLEDLLEE